MNIHMNKFHNVVICDNALFHQPLANVVFMVRNTMMEDIKNIMSNMSGLKSFTKTYQKRTKPMKNPKLYNLYFGQWGVVCSLNFEHFMFASFMIAITFALQAIQSFKKLIWL